jgi:UDP-glucose 6-dehydrogenase
MELSILGAVDVGLVSDTSQGELGHHVVCMEVDPIKIDQLKTVLVLIWEPGLKVLVERNVKVGRLHFTADSALAVQHGQVHFIALGTPPNQDGFADMLYVLAVSEVICGQMSGYGVIVKKFTVPVGAAEKVAVAINAVIASATWRSMRPPPNFGVVFNPEFLKEGAAVNDFLKPDRSIIGADSRIGYHFIFYGCGYKCSCFPKDVHALARSTKKIGYDALLLQTVGAVNCRLMTTPFAMLAQHFGVDSELKGKTIASWGLAFKPNTGHMRTAPVRTLMEALLQAGARVQAFDPVALKEADRIHVATASLTLCADKKMRSTPRCGRTGNLHRMATVWRLRLRRDSGTHLQQSHRGRTRPVTAGQVAGPKLELTFGGAFRHAHPIASQPRLTLIQT